MATAPGDFKPPVDPKYLVDPKLDLHPLETNRMLGGEAMNPRYMVDVEGKVPYSVYENKPELYDMDGKHEYKYFSQMKHLAKLRESSDSTNDSSNAQSVPGSTPTPNANIAIPPRSGSQSHDGSPQLGYDLDGKFTYTVYDPKVHEHLFAKTQPPGNYRNSGEQKSQSGAGQGTGSGSTPIMKNMPLSKGSQSQDEVNPQLGYDIDGKFSYTVYDPKVHEHLFAKTQPPGYSRNNGDYKSGTDQTMSSQSVPIMNKMPYSLSHDGSPQLGYDLEGKFAYTVYDPKVHEHLFSKTQPPGNYRNIGDKSHNIKESLQTGYDENGKFNYTVYDPKVHEHLFAKGRSPGSLRKSGDGNSQLAKMEQSFAQNLKISNIIQQQQRNSESPEVSPRQGYDLEGKFNYTVYDPKVHKHLFANKTKEAGSDRSSTRTISSSSESQSREGSPKVDYDLDGKFSYSTYDPNVHKQLFATAK